MGLTKQYLRYRCSGVCNIVGSGRGGGVFLNKDVAAVASVGDVALWDLRKKEKRGSLIVDSKKKLEVTSVAASPADVRLVAVGYSDGSIRLWDVGTREVEVTFTGHKTEVTCLTWDQPGLRLVSGSRDTNVIVWDVVAECGIARLKGHKVKHQLSTPSSFSFHLQYF